jgi:hypothetical protein
VAFEQRTRTRLEHLIRSNRLQGLANVCCEICAMHPEMGRGDELQRRLWAKIVYLVHSSLARLSLSSTIALREVLVSLIGIHLDVRFAARSCRHWEVAECGTR